MQQTAEEAKAAGRVRQIGLVAGAACFLALLFAPLPPGMPAPAGAVAALAALMAIWWMTEALPLAATALLPIVVLPLLAQAPIEAVTPAYAHPLIFLFLGGFFIARALERWHLHRSLALYLARIGGGGPSALVGALMVATALLSMWISNTAAALVMVPIGQLVVRQRRPDLSDDASETDFAAAMMLGIAFSASIGGMATLIGTPPNALFAAFLQKSYGIEIGFARWMAIGLPVTLTLLPVTWLILTRLAFRVPRHFETQPEIDRGAPDIQPPLSKPAKTAALVILLAALALVFRPALQGLAPGLPLSDSGIAMTAALVLFATPARWSDRTMLLTWDDVHTIRWDVLILFGGGLALASAIDESGLSRWIGSGFEALGHWPLALTVLAAMVVVVYLGELASNTAMAAVFLPVAGAAAAALGQPPMTLLLPVALAASLGFMLPVATPPNAIVFGSGDVSAAQMLKAGAILNVAGIVVVYVIATLLGPMVFAG